jgi:hypothetical protein
VGIQDELVIVGTARPHQMLLGGGQSLLLDVEGVYKAPRAYGLGQKLGVMSVPHGEIHRHVTVAKMLEDEILVKLEKIDHMVDSLWNGNFKFEVVVGEFPVVLFLCTFLSVSR